MYDILHSICWHLNKNLDADKTLLFSLVHADTNCSYEDFIMAYNEVLEAYIK